jgi:hypothetical protein
VDFSGGDDIFRPGTSAPTRNSVFDDESLEFDGPVSNSEGRNMDRSRSSCDDHFPDKIGGVETVNEETDGDEVLDAAEPATASDDVVTPRVSFKRLMHEKVDMLPIPSALKDYLLYYRKL